MGLMLDWLWIIWLLPVRRYIEQQRSGRGWCSWDQTQHRHGIPHQLCQSKIALVKARLPTPGIQPDFPEPARAKSAISFCVIIFPKEDVFSKSEGKINSSWSLSWLFQVVTIGQRRTFVWRASFTIPLLMIKIVVSNLCTSLVDHVQYAVNNTSIFNGLFDEAWYKKNYRLPCTYWPSLAWT